MSCDETNTKNLMEILAEIEDIGLCNGYDDLLYTSAKIYLRDSNGLSVRIDVPTDFFNEDYEDSFSGNANKNSSKNKTKNKKHKHKKHEEIEEDEYDIEP